jgi:hypothetical protein
MSIGRNVGYLRWHDRIPELAQAVRLMEKMPRLKQHVISDAIVSLMPLHQVPQRTDGLKKVGNEKILGLLKSKVKRRWYDQDPLVHQAFTYLYLMDDPLRLEMAIKILISNKALDAIALTENNVELGLRLTRSIFDKSLAYLKQKTQFVIQPPEQTRPTARLERVVFSALAEQRRHFQEEKEKSFSDGIKASGNREMKVVRLRRVPEVKRG